MPAADEQVVDSPEECGQDARRVSGEGEVIAGECAASEPVAGGVMKVEQPYRERGPREGEPGGSAAAPLEDEPPGENQRGHDTGFLNQHKDNTGQSRSAKPVLQKKKQRGGGGAHGRHIELSQTALG